MAVAPFEKRKECIFLAPFTIKRKELVLMIFCLHLLVTYDNYRRTYCAYSFNCNDCEFKKSQIEEKDNRPADQS